MSQTRTSAPPPVTVVTSPASRTVARVEGSPLEGRATVRALIWDTARSEEDLVATFDDAMEDATALVVSPWFWPSGLAFTERRWGRAKNLQVIAGTFDNRFQGWLDMADADDRGVTVIDTSRSMTPTVAEFALAMTLNLLRDIPAAVQVVREGSWLTTGYGPEGFVHGDLTGRRVGLAGYGSINRRYRELLAPFRCSVMTHDPFVSSSDLRHDDVEPVASLVELASRSEVFVVGIPPTPATEGIIDSDVIDALPKGALLVLVTRMAVVDQRALWRRAERGELRVAVDVYDPEPPPPDASFRRIQSVLPTPHIAGNVFYCHRRCFTTACEDALEVLGGGTPRFRATVRDQLLYQGKLEAPETA